MNLLERAEALKISEGSGLTILHDYLHMINTEDNAPCHKSMTKMVKFNELGFELLPQPAYSPDLTISYYRHLAVLKKMLTSDEKVIAATEAHFE